MQSLRAPAQTRVRGAGPRAAPRLWRKPSAPKDVLLARLAVPRS